MTEGDTILALVDALTDLDETWGHARLGMALSAAFLAGTALSASELAGHLNQSDDTIRRLLRPLVNVGRVAVVKQGRTVSYMADATWAKRTAKRLRPFFS